MHTVIGVFDEMPQAQAARDKLQQAQFAPDHVHLGAGHLTAGGEIVTDSSGSRQKWENRNVLAALGSFWANLIESNIASSSLDGAMQRGSVVVAAQATTQDQAHQAARIFEECNALEVQHGEVVSSDREPQPWHAADEKGEKPARGSGSPLGTHSLTGGGVQVGLPTDTPERSRADRESERATASRPPEHSGVPDLLGRRPDANRER